MPSAPPPSSSSVTLLSKCTIYPSSKSAMSDLKLSVSDLPMLSCHYIQKGNLFSRPPISIPSLLSLLKTSLSETLTQFPPLAGRLSTSPDGHVFITSNDAGVDFLHATAGSLTISDVLSPLHVPDSVKEFFSHQRTVSYDGHFRPLMAVQVTELADGVFVGVSANHAIIDGTSLWNFFNTFSEIARLGFRKCSRKPNFDRDSVLMTDAVLKIPAGGPTVTFNENEPIRERIFSFSREAILKLKAKTNGYNRKGIVTSDKNGINGNLNAVEVMGKNIHDPYFIAKGNINGKVGSMFENFGLFRYAQTTDEISSFQSLCALLWRAVTRARKLPEFKTTTFRMAVNCRHRIKPKLDAYYFGNAIQSIATQVTAGEVLSRDLGWCAVRLKENVLAHDAATVRRFVEDWERNPRCFPLGNFDGATITMGSSPRFPMYDNDFGWGRPLAIRSGAANKFDGKISAFPGREGNGTVDLEVVLAPQTMAGIESDPEFMQYVST